MVSFRNGCTESPFGVLRGSGAALAYPESVPAALPISTSRASQLAKSCYTAQHFFPANKEY